MNYNLKHILTFTIFSALVVPLFWVSSSFSAATKPVNYCLMVKKLAPVQNYTDCQANPSDIKTISLSLGEKARFAMRVMIDREVIDELKYRVIFPLDKNPIAITASVAPDALPQQPLTMNLDLPDNTYLKYVPGTTVYETYLGDDQYNDMEISDVNGVSSLYANAGNWYTISKVGSPDEQLWTFMYFDMEVVAAAEDGPPTVPDPHLELKMTVGGDKTEATIASGSKVRVKVWIHNSQMDSVAKGVKLAVTLPGGTPGRSFTSTSGVTADNHGALSDLVKITSPTDVVLGYVEGSARLFKYEDTVGTSLTSSQVAALFGDGLLMGDNGSVVGCWIYQQWVEFDLAAASILGKKEVPKVLAATGPENMVATALYLGYLGFLLRRLKLTKFF